MSLITCTPELALQHTELDDTHEEFVGLLNDFATALAGGGDPMPAFEALLAHTEAHFAMEERWMAATGFAPENCHSKQHQMVLDTLREVRRYALELQDLEPMRIIGPELAQWFPAHAEMMDAALVFHMQQVGYDSTTGVLTKPEASEATALQSAQAAQTAQPITSCGSSSCGH